MSRRATKSFFPNCAVTGVGSLPFIDEGQACEFVNTLSPEIPFLPELPLLEEWEGLVARPFAGLKEMLKVTDGRVEIIAPTLHAFLDALRCDESRLLEQASAHTVKLAAAIKSAKTTAIKGQCLGIGTAVINISFRGKPLCAFSEALPIVSEYLIRYAERMAKILKAAAKNVILVFDEPSLGCTFPEGFSWPIIRSHLLVHFTRLSATGVVPGIHCCAPNWAIIGPELGYKLFSFDATSEESGVEAFLSGGEFVDFIEDGGFVSWGVVPTTEGLTGFSVEGAVQRIVSAIEARRLNVKEVLSHSIVTASCGLCFLSVEQARENFRLAAELSKNLRLRLTD